MKGQARDGSVIVAGGAAGSELAVRRGRRLGPERVTLGGRRAVGQLMGVLPRGSFFTHRLLTCGMYASLHLSHHAVLPGMVRTAAIAMSRLFVRRWMPRVRLH